MAEQVASRIETPVLIVGGGPVGMALGLVLARAGVESLIVERNPTTTEHPKSRGCTARSMETFRTWGIEQEVRAGAMQGDGTATWVCKSVTGRLIGTTRPSNPNVHSPSDKSMVAQDVIEVALDNLLASSFPQADLRRRHELVDFEQDDEGVTAHVKVLDTDEVIEVRTQYLVACDGAGSGVRRTLGIEMVGPDVLATLANYYYWADTSHVPQAHRPFIYFVIPDDPDVPLARIAPSGPSADRWLWITPIAPDAELYTDEELIRHARAHWGIPDLEVKPINNMRWRMSAQIPETFRKGRAILCGDAAHRFPPAGGMGLNSGLQDAVNLGWKLAFVVKGRAGDSLLDTYEQERKPIAESNNAWSQGNASRLPRVEEIFRRGDEAECRAALDELSLHTTSEGQGHGKIYAEGAFIPDGRAPLPHDPTYYNPTDRPGAWFPHMWLDTEQERTTRDWFDTAFVVVCGPRATAWREAAEAVAADSGGAVEVQVMPLMAGPFTFPDDGAVLVRPDGIVAWHPPAGTTDLEGSLREALATILGAA